MAGHPLHNIKFISYNSPFLVLDVLEILSDDDPNPDLHASCILSVLHGENQGLIVYPQSIRFLSELKRLK